jgi:hypothetical protein
LELLDYQLEILEIDELWVVDDSFQIFQVSEKTLAAG